MSSSSSVFRFLDLPKEIRLLVYECLPVKTRHAQVPCLYPWPNSWRPGMQCALVVRSFPVALLATCQLVYDEASAIFRPKLNELAATPPRVIFGLDNAGELEDLRLQPVDNPKSIVLIDRLIEATRFYAEITDITRDGSQPSYSGRSKASRSCPDYLSLIKRFVFQECSPPDLQAFVQFTQQATVHYLQADPGAIEIQMAIMWLGQLARTRRYPDLGLHPHSPIRDWSKLDRLGRKIQVFAIDLLFEEQLRHIISEKEQRRFDAELGFMQKLSTVGYRNLLDGGVMKMDMWEYEWAEGERC